jgi:hypothetical protein
MQLLGDMLSDTELIILDPRLEVAQGGALQLEPVQQLSCARAQVDSSVNQSTGLLGLLAINTTSQ